MKNNFELYDSIKAMMNAPKPKVEPLAGLSEKSLAAYAKKGPNSPISGQYQSAHTIAEEAASEVIETTEETKTEEATDIELSEEELQAIADQITEAEFEQLDELSKQKLGQYIKKAKSDLEDNAEDRGRLGGLSRWDRTDTDVKNHRFARNQQRKRSKGIDKATDKLTKEDVEVSFSEAEIVALEEASGKSWQDLKNAEDVKNSKQFNSHRQGLDAHYKQEAHKILKKHGYELVHGAGNHSIYTNNNIKNKTHYTATVFHDKHSPSSVFTTNSGAVTRHNSVTHLDKDEHEKEKLHMPATFESALINHHKNTTYHHTYE